MDNLSTKQKDALIKAYLDTVVTDKKSFFNALTIITGNKEKAHLVATKAYQVAKLSK